jgi:hypothetical protein
MEQTEQLLKSGKYEESQKRTTEAITCYLNATITASEQLKLCNTNAHRAELIKLAHDGLAAAELLLNNA